MPWVESRVVSIEPSTGSLKLGQPVPLSNLRADRNKTCPQPAQENSPERFSPFSAQEPGASVPCWRITANCSGVSSARHSASECATLNVFDDIKSPLAETWALDRPIYDKGKANKPGFRRLRVRIM